jgi:O-antigen/teichoic acid export membrane protein
MIKAADVAKASVEGSFHLLWGLVVSTVISAIGTVYLGNLLTSDEMGLYTLALAAPNLIGLFRDWGVNEALIRYTAKCNSEKDVIRAKKILIKSLIFQVVVGVVLTAVSFLLSAVFADIYRLASIAPLIRVGSFTVLMNAFLTVAQAAFTGLERLELNSITLIVQSAVKAAVTIALVILGQGVFGAVLGYTISFVVAGVTATLLLWLPYRNLSASASVSSFTKSSQRGAGKTENTDNLTTLLRFGSPLSVASKISTFQTQIYMILMGIYATADAVGNYAIASTFVVLITFFATPIATMLFPAFSKLDLQEDYEAIRSVYQFSVKYAALLVVPVTAIVMALSEPATSTLFGNKYVSAPLFLSLLAISYAYTAFGSLTVTNFASGQGKTVFNLKLTIFTAVIGFPLSIILAQQFGVIGIIVTTLTSGLLGLIVALHWVKKHYKLSIDWSSSAKILLTSALAGAVAYILQKQLNFVSVINLIIGLATFLVVFLPSILITGTIDKPDIDNLRAMTASLGPVSRLLNPTLTFIEKLLSLINKSGRGKISSSALEILKA